MKRNQSSGVWNTLLIVAVAALAVTFSQATQAAANESDETQGEEGRVVEISPQKGDANVDDKAADAGPLYWLGIEGGPLDSDVLRTHLQLADDVGVVIRGVSSKSPAEKAGLRQHDVIIGVGREQVTGMETLQKAVADSNGKPIELKVIRLAKEETFKVTPEKMPKDLADSRNSDGGAFNFNWQGMPQVELNDMLKELQAGGGAGIRVFGPGMVMNGQGIDANSLPGGVSVNITRENDGPASVTVKKGDKTWNFKSDDVDAINELPDDVRKFVVRMLGGPHGPNIKLRQFQMPNPVRIPFPGGEGQIDVEAIRKRSEEASKRMMKQMEQMEKQLQQMQQRFEERFPAEGTNPGADPSKT